MARALSVLSMSTSENDFEFLARTSVNGVVQQRPARIDHKFPPTILRRVGSPLKAGGKGFGPIGRKEPLPLPENVCVSSMSTPGTIGILDLFGDLKADAAALLARAVAAG